MNTEIEELAERIRGETLDLDRLVQRALSAWNRSKKVSKEQDVYLDSVALNLHGKIEPLISDLPGLWSQVHAELRAFAGFLSDLAQTSKT